VNQRKILFASGNKGRIHFKKRFKGGTLLSHPAGRFAAEILTAVYDCVFYDLPSGLRVLIFLVFPAAILLLLMEFGFV